jgi:hypothetical protein
MLGIFLVKLGMDYWIYHIDYHGGLLESFDYGSIMDLPSGTNNWIYPWMIGLLENQLKDTQI